MFGPAGTASARHLFLVDFGLATPLAASYDQRLGHYFGTVW